jgi:HEAT repeat protein
MALFGPPSVQKLLARENLAGLVRALGHKSVETRAEAARALGVLGGAKAAMALVRALGDADA